MSGSLLSFMSAMRAHESQGNGGYSALNSLGYIGGYQFGEQGLVDIGWIVDDSNYNNNYQTYTWTAASGITSYQDFLADPDLQDKAFIASLFRHWQFIRNRDHEYYADQTLNNEWLTISGMVAVSHSIGSGSIRDFINSGGIDEGTPDHNGYTLLDALSDFANYDLSDTTGIDPDLLPMGFSDHFNPHHEMGNDLEGGSGNDILYGGGGGPTGSSLDIRDDLFLGATGGIDFLFGGTEVTDIGDTLNYADVSTELLIRYVSETDGEAILRISTEGGDWVDYVNNMETIKVNAGIFAENDEAADALSMEEISIVNLIGGETINFSPLQNGILIDFTREEFGRENSEHFAKFSGYINALGGSGNDTITGNSEINIIKGRGGDDSISGGEEDSLAGAETSAVIDMLDGGSGNDTVSASTGLDSVFGGTGDDTLIEHVDADIEDQEDGGTLYGGEGNDIVDVTLSVDASTLFGGSGNDVLYGNGASTLFGGSGVDEFHIVTVSTPQGPDMPPLITFDTIVDAETQDRLWIDGIEITVDSPDVIFAREVGGIEGHGYAPVLFGGELVEVFSSITAPITVLFVATGLAGDFSGKLQDIVYDLYIYKNETIYAGTTGLVLSEADFILHDFRQGDYGLFESGFPNYPGPLVFATQIVGRLVHDGIDYRYGNFPVGSPHVLTEDELTKERLIEEFQRLTEDLPVLDASKTTDGTGTSENDLISGDDNDGSFSGDDGDDIVVAYAGDDLSFGGSGLDFLSGGEGSDSLSGDDGADTIYGDWSPSEPFTSSSENSSDSDWISGGAGNDSAVGDDGADTVSGDEGDDTVVGGEGTDLLYGGTENDYLDAGEGNDTLSGDAGNDTVLGGLGTDLVYGGDGDDVVAGNGEQDSVFGEAGNDTVSGGEGNDIIYGGTGSDGLVGATGDDTLSGGQGDDYLQGGFEDDTYNYASGDGNDTIFDSGHYLDIDNINFSDIASTAVQYGRVNDDLVIYINDGSKITIRNQFRVSSEAVELAHFSDDVTVNLLTVSPFQTSVLGTAGDDYLFGVNSTTSELIDGFAGNDSVGAFGGSDSVYGGDGNDTLQGGSDADLMYGGNDDDILDGGTGNDTLFGGAGNDTFIVDSTADVVTENLNEGTDTVQSAVTFTLSETVEHLTLTGTADIDGTGNALDNLIVGNSPSGGFFGTGGANRLYGLGGNDTLIGGGGADTLDGGIGADSMVGGDGADTFIVDDVLDLTIELSGEGVDLVSSSINWTLDTYVENLTLTGSSALNGTGSIAGNVITGNTGENLLSGLAGNDTLIGGDGNDILDGGADTDSLVGGLGDDLYVVDNTNDKAVEAAIGGIDTVESSATFTLGAEVENLTLTGSEAINGTGNTIANIVTGNSQGNSLSGLAGNDILFGDSGDDTLDGGTGTDSLVGGVGNDTYIVDVSSDAVIEAVGEGTDLIQSGLALTLAANIENLTITGTAGVTGAGNELANLITGNSGANNLSGLDGDDTIVGAAGHDTLDGGTGNDSLAGGIGNDMYLVDTVSDVVVEQAGEGTDHVQATVSWTLGAELENLTLTTGSAAINGTGNALANILTGNGGENLLSGLDGNDTLIASDGNDMLDGGAGVDSMTGGAGDDLYIVEDVLDKAIEAAAGGNDLVQSLVSFTLGLNIENLTLTGTDAIDGTGNTSSNLILGNSADNLLSGGTGNDTLVGGAGNDTFVVDIAGDVLSEEAGGGTDLVQSSVSWTLGSELENLTLTGSTSNDGTGNELANILTGNTGANALYGAAGNDTLDGDSGVDILDGGLGTDSMIGGAGNDTFFVDVASDVIVELASGGIDTIKSTLTWTLAAELENLTLIGSAAINGTGNTLANILTGNTENNGLYGGGENDTLSGDMGDDTLNGGAGNDILNAGAGNDTLNGGVGNDSMTGGAGDDVFTVDDILDKTVEASGEGNDLVQSSVSFALALNIERLQLTGTVDINGTGNTLANVITGNSGANFLTGDNGNDSLIGNGGNDTLDGGSGNDSMTGGAGDDAYYVDATSDVVVEAAGGGTDAVTSSATYTLSANVENLTLSGTAGNAGAGNTLANLITGNTGANNLTGLDGDDTLDGGDGADWLDGGLGTDSMIGGAGNDTFVVDVSTDVIVEVAAGGTDLVRADLTWTLGAELENLILIGSAAMNGTGNTLANTLTGNTGDNGLYGGTENDTLLGDAGNDTLNGGSGNDILDAGDGNDTLNGGVGNDSMTGGAGDDVYNVDDILDKTIETTGEGNDLVQSSVSFTLAVNIERIQLTGTADINGTGNTLANVLTGNTGANLLSGSSGNDTLIGNAGNDTLDGGTGNDSMTGGSGDDGYTVDATLDAVVEAAGGGTDTVTSSTTHTLAVNVENLILSGTSSNAGTGNTLANSLTGNTGANTLSGLDGNDTLTGGGGNDALNGGIGADRFVFTSTTSGVDVIADFNEMDGGSEEGDVLRFDGLKVGTFVYLGTSAFSGGSDNSEARVSGNQVLFDANGDGTADITITLTGLTAASQLAATDFLFV